MFIPGPPLAADGDTLDDAIVDMIEALREYAHDWQGRLLNAPTIATTGGSYSWWSSALTMS